MWGEHGRHLENEATNGRLKSIVAEKERSGESGELAAGGVARLHDPCGWGGVGVALAPPDLLEAMSSWINWAVPRGFLGLLVEIGRGGGSGVDGCGAL